MQDVKILKSLGFSDYFINLLLQLSAASGEGGLFSQGITNLGDHIVMGGTISTNVVINGVAQPTMMFKFFDIDNDMILANGTTAIRLNSFATNIGDVNFQGNGTLISISDSSQQISLGNAVYIDIANMAYTFGNYKLSEFCLLNKTVSAANYTMTSTDSGKILNFTNAGGCVVSLATGFFGLPIGFTCTLVQQGAGPITFSLFSTTLNNRLGQFESAGQYAIMSLISTSLNTFILGGDTA